MDHRKFPIQMKQSEFVTEDGCRCPYCRSLDVHPIKPARDCEDEKLRRKMRCYECGLSWDEVYKLCAWEGL